MQREEEEQNVHIPTHSLIYFYGQEYGDKYTNSATFGALMRVLHEDSNVAATFMSGHKDLTLMCGPQFVELSPN